MTIRDILKASKTTAIVCAMASSTIAVCSCSTTKAPTDGPRVVGSGEVVNNPDSPQVVVGQPALSQPSVKALPRAVVYKMNGDYADYVPVTLNPQGTALVSYPAPTDLTASSTPLPMADGYYLDRRGINQNSRFTRWTYKEYQELPQAPTPSELLDNLIPDARVTTVRVLPMTLSEALSDTAAVNRAIRQL